MPSRRLPVAVDGFDVVPDRLHADTAAGQVLDRGEHVDEVAPEPVDPSDDDRVAFAGANVIDAFSPPPPPRGRTDTAPCQERAERMRATDRAPVDQQMLADTTPSDTHH